jgi:CRP-like cAMP-binding protein
MTQSLSIKGGDLRPPQSGDSDLSVALHALAAQGWFAQRSEATRARLSGIARLRHFAKDERLYLVGDAPNGVFGLVSGSLNISYPRGDGEDYTVHRAGAGFWFGDLALFSDQPRLVSAHAAEPTVTVHLASQDLARLVREDPRLYADFYSLTYENYALALRIISNLAIASTDKRLADRLLHEVKARGDADGWISVSQPELAKLLAVSLPTMQRIMRRMVKNGVVRTSYGRVCVLDRDALAKICGDPGIERHPRQSG